jgi:hypothetical protein
MGSTDTLDVFINVTGTNDLLQGLNFNAVSGDGGPELGGTPGPTFTADILTGTIFAGNNTGVTTNAIFPQAVQLSTTTNTGTVNSLGRLATLHLSTSNLAPGVYALDLFGSLAGDTELLDQTGMPITTGVFTNGTVTVVPEPSTAILGAFGLVSVVAWRLRKRQIRNSPS